MTDEILAQTCGLCKRVYSSSRLVTLRVLGLGGPLGEELQGSSVAEGLVEANGVIGSLPVEQFVVELGDLERAGGEIIKLLRVGGLGALDGTDAPASPIRPED